MPPIVIAVVALGVISLFLFAFMLLPRGSSLDKRLADLDRGAVLSETEQNVFAKLMDANAQSKLQRKLNAAGWYEISPAKFALRTAYGAAAGIIAALVLIFIVGDTSTNFLIAGGIAIFAGCALPTVSLNRAVEKRQKAIHNEISDFLDMLTTTIDAGISLNGALASTVDAVSGPLAEELKAALSDIRLGRARGDALMAMANRVGQPDLLATMLSIVQAEKLGGNLAGVLEELSHEAREKRMVRAEELAAQLPVKMVFPMALFMLPALVVIIFGPVFANFLSGR